MLYVYRITGEWSRRINESKRFHELCYICNIREVTLPETPTKKFPFFAMASLACLITNEQSSSATFSSVSLQITTGAAIFIADSECVKPGPTYNNSVKTRRATSLFLFVNGRISMLFASLENI